MPVTGAPALKLLKPLLQAQSTPLKDTSLFGKEHSSESMARQSSPGAPGEGVAMPPSSQCYLTPEWSMQSVSMETREGDSNSGRKGELFV